MIEILIIALIVWSVVRAKKGKAESDKSVRRRQPTGTVTPSTPNRALTAMRNRANELLTQTVAPQSAPAMSGNASGTQRMSGATGAGYAATSRTGASRTLANAGKQTSGQAKPTKIAQRRKQQQQNADRSRIHQNLHEKEAKTEIRFGAHELMDEVYDIMACGYPSGRSGQRDFLAEGQALLDRYTLG